MSGRRDSCVEPGHCLGGPYAPDCHRARWFCRPGRRGGPARWPDAIDVADGERRCRQELHYHDRARGVRQLRRGGGQRHHAARRHRHRHGRLHQRGACQSGPGRRRQRARHHAPDGRSCGRVSALRTLQGHRTRHHLGRRRRHRPRCPGGAKPEPANSPSTGASRGQDAAVGNTPIPSSRENPAKRCPRD